MPMYVILVVVLVVVLLVAGLLVFRALYFMIPFCFALITMAIWEATLFFRRGRVEARVVEAAEISERTARNR